MTDSIDRHDLGRLAYTPAYEAQLRHHADILASREAGGTLLGRLLTVEHDPVITVSNRPGAAGHVVASEARLAAEGVEVAKTDRGGDVTYHGPGQVVVYTILDLKRLRLGLHEHLRLMEDAVIDVLSAFGVRGHRDPDATGVWIGDELGGRKVCAMGVRVRRWVTFHGLALNVTTDLSHFDLIVPCGLAGRRVTSLRAELGSATPTWQEVADAVTNALRSRLGETEIVHQAEERNPD